MKHINMCLSIIAVAVLLIPGCSGAYTSDMQTTGETTNDSFTALLYSNTNIFNGSISYKVIDGKNTIEANLYTLISGAHLIIYGSATYALTYEVHIYDSAGELDADAYLFIGDTPADEVELNPDTVYDIQLNILFSAIEFTGTITCSLTLTITAIHNNCTYVDSGNCATIEVEDDPIAEQVEVEEGEDVEGQYNKTSVTEQGYPQVIITNTTNSSGGVADEDGNINITLSIPASTPFCIKIWNKEGYDVYANIVINNILVNGSAGSHSYNNQKLGAGFARYFCHYTTSGTYGSEYWSTTNLNNVKNNNGWFQSSNGSVTISIDAHYNDGHGNTAQNVRLSVVFKEGVGI